MGPSKSTAVDYSVLIQTIIFDVPQNLLVGGGDNGE